MEAALEIDANLDFVCQQFSRCHTISCVGLFSGSYRYLWMPAIGFLAVLSVYSKLSLLMYALFLTGKFRAAMCLSERPNIFKGKYCPTLV